MTRLGWVLLSVGTWRFTVWSGTVGEPLFLFLFLCRD